LIIIFLRKNLIRCTVQISLTFLLISCSDAELVKDLSQKQAIEVVAELSNNQISAKALQQTGAGAKFYVTVPNNLYLDSVKILSLRNLPNESEQNLDNLLGGQGLLPQSRVIEAIRVDRALAVEIENQLNALPGVSSAKALVRTTSLGNEGRSKGVALIVVHNPKKSNLTYESLLKQLSVIFPDVSSERIKLELLEDKTNLVNQDSALISMGKSVNDLDLVNFLWFAKIDRSKYITTSIIFLALMLSVGAVGAFFGYIYSQYVGGMFEKKSSNTLTHLTELNAKTRKFNELKENLTNTPETTSDNTVSIYPPKQL
jgi:type III secretory pathway lipoprotein EscJ